MKGIPNTYRLISMDPFDPDLSCCMDTLSSMGEQPDEFICVCGRKWQQMSADCYIASVQFDEGGNELHSDEPWRAGLEYDMDYEFRQDDRMGNPPQKTESDPFEDDPPDDPEDDPPDDPEDDDLS